MKTKATQARGVESWSKEVLSQIFVENGSEILEYFPESGKNIGKWERFGVKYYSCLDSLDKSLKETVTKYNEKKRPFLAEFHPYSPCAPALKESPTMIKKAI